ncbi:MAG: hypothetical protein JWN14_3217 [Chthonomonadales bacterium]|nr:hypothetical protein [Chthonomonadales bacterium]
MMPEVPSLHNDTRLSDDRDAPDEKGPPQTSLPPAHLGRSLRLALRSIWDRLGVVLLISLIGTGVLLLSLLPGLVMPAALPFLLRTAVIALLLVILSSPLLAVAFDIALRIFTHREVTPALLPQSVRRYGSVSIRLGLIHLCVGVVAALNVTFYLQLSGAAGRAIVLLCTYLAVFWSTMALYQGPLLVLQESGAFDEPDKAAKRGAKAIIRRSFFLVIGEPLFSIGLLAAALLWSVLTMLTGPGAAMLWLGGGCLLTTAPTLALLAKYGVIDPVVSEDAPPQKEA